MQGNQFRRKLLQIFLTVELAVSEFLNPIIKKQGITLRQYYVLSVIQEQKFITIGNLASILNLAQSNVSTTCKIMESKGLMERVRQKDDERIVTLRLTKRGQKLLDDLNHEFEYLDAALANFPDERIALAMDGYVEFSDLISNRKL